MGIATIVAYIATFASVYFSVTGFPGLVLAMVLGAQKRPRTAKEIEKSAMATMFAGYLFAWALVDLLWFSLEGGHIPLVALIGVIVFTSIHSKVSATLLNPGAQVSIGAEQSAVIAVGVYLFFFTSSPARWY